MVIFFLVGVACLDMTSLFTPSAFDHDCGFLFTFFDEVTVVRAVIAFTGGYRLCMRVGDIRKVCAVVLVAGRRRDGGVLIDADADFTADERLVLLLSDC